MYHSFTHITRRSSFRARMCTQTTTHSNNRYITAAMLIPCYDVPSPEHDHLTKSIIESMKSNSCEKTKHLAVTHILSAASLEIAEHEDSISEGDAMSVLLRWSLNALLEMSADSRAKCLSTESSIVDIDGVIFDVPVMVTRWDPCSVVNDVAQNITGQRLRTRASLAPPASGQYPPDAQGLQIDAPTLSL